MVATVVKSLFLSTWLFTEVMLHGILGGKF
jgi:hypothetical protein